MNIRFVLAGFLCLLVAAPSRTQAEFVLDFVGSGDSSWVDVGGGSNVASWSTTAPASISSYYDRFVFNTSPITTNAPLLVGDNFRLSGRYSLYGSSALGQIFFLTNNSIFGFTLSNDDDPGLDLIRLWYADGGSPSVIGLVGVDVGGTFDFDVDASGIAAIEYDVYFQLGAGGGLSMTGSVFDSSGLRYTFNTNLVITGLTSAPQDLFGVAIASDMISSDDNTQGAPQLLASPIDLLQWGYTTIPEPGTIALISVGLFILIRLRSHGTRGRWLDSTDPTCARHGES